MKTRLEHVRANVMDLNAAIGWYRGLLGFEIDALWPTDGPNYAQFKAQIGAAFSVMQGPIGAARFNFSVEDPDALWAKLRDDPRVAVVESLFDTPYGTRKFTIADPDGNELGFVRNSGTAS